jgi:hypothetical protein
MMSLLLYYIRSLTVTHETLDQIKLAQHKLIAKQLRENPKAIVALTRCNLRRYIDRRPAPATSLWREWRTLLDDNSIEQAKRQADFEFYVKDRIGKNTRFPL